MEFQNNLIKFIFDTMCAPEYISYENFQKDEMVKLPLSLLKMEFCQPILNSVISHYLNECHKAIILKDNEDIMEKLNTIKNSKSENEHTYMCILHLTFNIINLFYEKITRQNLDISNIDDYMTSFQNEFNRVYVDNIDLIRTILNHTCIHKDEFSKVNPNDKLFEAFETEQDQNEYIGSIRYISKKFIEDPNLNPEDLK
mgnify:CR=1 FL=1